MKKIIFILMYLFASFQFSEAQMSFDENSVKIQNYKQISKNSNEGHFFLGGGFGMMGPSINTENDIMGTKHEMIGFGGHINTLYFTKPGSALGLNIGYYGFQDIRDEHGDADYNEKLKISSYVFSLMIQHLFFFGEGKLKPFAGFGEGVSLFIESYTEEYTSPNHGEEIYTSSNEYPFLNFTPSLGINSEISDRLYLNFTARFILGMNTKISSDPEALPDLFCYFPCFNLDVMFKL
ncbi:hypothetical protein ACFL6I_10235 [candidate division KSB1 bacterium]